MGFFWVLAWWWLFRDQPEDHPWISQKEKDEILSLRQQTDQTAADKLSLRAMRKSTNVWMVVTQYFCSNFTFFFALTWLFPHLKSKYNLEALEAGWYAVAPFLAGALGNWLAGGWVDKIFRDGQWNRSRRLPSMIGFLLAAFGMIGSVYMDTPLGAVAMLSLAIMGADMTLPPSWSLCVDIGKERSGTVSGTMNMAGNLGSFLTALVFPYLTAWTGSVDYFFYVAAGLNLIGLMCWSKVRADQGLAW